MKTLRSIAALFAFLLLMVLGTSPVQAQSDISGNVRDMIRSGASKELAKFFNTTVEVGLDGNKSNYSQTQAEFVRKDFFAKNQPASFDYIHQGSSREGLKYVIGKLNSANGSYRVYILFRQAKGAYVIDTIDFTKE